MSLRKHGWLVVCLAAIGAVVAAPAPCRADISIQVTETGTAPASESFGPTTGSVLNTGSATLGAFSISNISASLGASPNAASLTTNLNLGFTSNFALNSGDVLTITVTASNIANAQPGANGLIMNQAGASNGIISDAGTLTVSSTSTVNGVSTASSTAVAGGVGTTSGQPTSASSDIPANYSIVETITVSVSPSGSINTASTIGGTISTTVSVVPAPGGLALALAALPLFGLRRLVNRKKAEVATKAL